MRLRVQLVLVALGATLLCGGLGVGVIWRNVNASAETMLNRELHIARTALLRQWQLSNVERQRAYEAIVRQPYLRAYLAQRDQSQMDYYATALINAGAESAAILDRDGTVLSHAGKGTAALVTRVAANPVAESGSLVATPGSLLNAYQLPVVRAKGEKPIGYVLVGNAVDPGHLAENAHALGIEVALTAGVVLLSSFPRAELSAAGWDVGAGRTQVMRLRWRYQLAIGNYGDAQLAVAVPRDRMRALTTTFPAQFIGLILISALGIVIVCLVILIRINEPMETLRSALGRLGHGHIAESLRILHNLPSRKDEFGELGEEFRAAALRINAVVKQCQRLSLQLTETVRGLDRTAGDLASGAKGQEARLKDLTEAIEPLTKATEQTAITVDSLAPLGSSIALATQNIEEDTEALLRLMRRLEVHLTPGTGGPPGPAQLVAGAQQLGALIQEEVKLIEQLRQIRGQTKKLAHNVSTLSRSLIHEQYQGDYVLRGMAHIGRLGQEHSKQAVELRATAENLRHEIDHLNDALTLFDTETENFSRSSR